jgi:hypothetical protein
MLKQYVSSPPSAGPDADNVVFAFPPGEPVLRDEFTDIPQDAAALAQSVRDQLARELAEIEAATAALRRAEPELESWTKTPANTGGKPRPVWLLVGVLWLSTALVTAGAVAAIATFAG